MTRFVLPSFGAFVVVLVVAAATHHRSPVDLVLALILSPAACVATALVARRLAGRRFALAAAWVYVVLPLLGGLYALSTYRHTFFHGAVPQLVGLHEPQWLLIAVVAALVAAVAPATSVGALGTIALVVALVTWGTGGLADVKGGLHETGWSPTFIAWAFVAGVVGSAVRRPLFALGLGGWAAAVILGAANGGYGSDGEFWRALAAATPALALLLTSIALLVPRLRPARTPARSDAG
ncbi:MAG TPA: hypothetical protein VHC67_19070 [Gaiellaceae bacterium]|jgi:hypothetical protein|nr:hypothetical protein [Gaiellaceae bacterium]